jgi:hypothetical protein
VSDRMTNVRLEVAAAMVVERVMSAAMARFNRDVERWERAIAGEGWLAGTGRLASSD